MNDSSTTVLLIGGAGYLGSVLTPILLDQGYNVKVYDNFLFGSVGLDSIKHPNLKIIKGDICNVKAISKACEGVDSVVLMAAIVGRRLNDVQRSTMRDINLLASSVVVDAAIEHGVERFIFTSSDNVYGTASGVIYETAVPEPKTLYSRLKLRMEERIINAKNRDFHPSILRIGSCFGFSPRMRFDLPANQLLREAAIKKEIHLPSGEEKRAFIHVKDAARAIYLCLSGHLNLVSGEIFNICGEGQCVSMQEVTNKISSLLSDTSVTTGGKTAEVNDYKLSSSKIVKLLDFETEHDIESGLAEVLEAIRSRQVADPYSLQFNNNG